MHPFQKGNDFFLIYNWRKIYIHRTIIFCSQSSGNLFNNAIEAADGNPVELSVRQSSTDSSYVIEVEDHGPGIDPEDMEQIFEPGFSTKINYETGEVNRGLGLSLVKDFIEFRLGGTIRVTSVPGKTVFTLTIPKEKWSGL